MAANTKYIGFSVSPAMYRKAQKLAQEQHRSVSGLMRKMLEEAITGTDDVCRQIGAPMQDMGGIDP